MKIGFITSMVQSHLSIHMRDYSVLTNNFHEDNNVSAYSLYTISFWFKGEISIKTNKKIVIAFIDN
jgi:hypothetical protein